MNITSIRVRVPAPRTSAEPESPESPELALRRRLAARRSTSELRRRLTGLRDPAEEARA